MTKRKVTKEAKHPTLAITLRTVVNGYLLNIDREGYMYFDIQSLLEGFCIHLGMERLDCMTKEEIHDMIVSLKDGGVVKKLQAEVNELKAVVSSQKVEIRKLKRELKELENSQFIIPKS